jgi:hypothetical protein
LELVTVAVEIALETQRAPKTNVTVNLAFGKCWLSLPPLRMPRDSKELRPNFGTKFYRESHYAGGTYRRLWQVEKMQSVSETWLTVTAILHYSKTHATNHR